MTGTGPDAVRGKTYFEIQMEQAELDLSIRRRKPGVGALPPGQVPRIPGYTWNTGDRAPEPPLGE